MQTGAPGSPPKIYMSVVLAPVRWTTEDPAQGPAGGQHGLWLSVGHWTDWARLAEPNRRGLWPAELCWPSLIRWWPFRFPTSAPGCSVGGSAPPTYRQTLVTKLSLTHLVFYLDYKHPFFVLAEVKSTINLYLELSFSLTIVETPFLEDVPFHLTKVKSLWWKEGGDPDVRSHRSKHHFPLS
jgi:hypothetical protein